MIAAHFERPTHQLTTFAVATKTTDPTSVTLVSVDCSCDSVCDVDVGYDDTAAVSVYSSRADGTLVTLSLVGHFPTTVKVCGATDLLATLTFVSPPCALDSRAAPCLSDVCALTPSSEECSKLVAAYCATAPTDPSCALVRLTFERTLDEPTSVALHHKSTVQEVRVTNAACKCDAPCGGTSVFVNKATFADNLLTVDFTPSAIDTFTVCGDGIPIFDLKVVGLGCAAARTGEVV
jgi:hypothetical protein